MTEDTEPGRPTDTHRETVLRGYVRRRYSHIIYPALFNAGSAIVMLLLCYGLGIAVVAVAKPSYGLTSDVVRTAIGWLGLLYIAMIVGVSLQGMWYLSKAEISAAHRSDAEASPQAAERP